MSQQQTFNNFSSPAESGVLQIGVDTSTSPGTNPVTPDDDGQINVTGGQVAAGTTANVIRTDSLADHEYTIQIQRSQAVASSTVGDNGVCHFSSTDFNVDANGFVQSAIPSFKWTVTSSTSFTPSNFTGYILVGASQATITLPSAPALDFWFAVLDQSGNTFVIAQNNGDSIQVLDDTTTTGTGGSITSTMTGDSIHLVCWAQGPGASWVAVDVNGQMSLV